MCIAVPGEIKEILGDGCALVDFMGVKKRVVLDLIEKAEVGDYVIVHAGFAINKLNREEAIETLECFEELFKASGRFQEPSNSPGTPE